MKRFAEYGPNVGPGDRHVGLFWTAMAELSAAQMESLLRKMWKKTLQSLLASGGSNGGSSGVRGSGATFAALMGGTEFSVEGYGRSAAAESAASATCGAVFCTKLARMPAPFRVFQPTAVALLLPDDGELVVLPDQCAISVPRYSTLEIMHKQLQRIVS